MTYPHTLTPEQFAIISVALDNARKTEVAYVAKHEDRPDDYLQQLDELRKLWAFAGDIVINPRRAPNRPRHHRSEPSESESRTGVCSTCREPIGRDGTCAHVRALLGER